MDLNAVLDKLETTDVVLDLVTDIILLKKRDNVFFLSSHLITNTVVDLDYIKEIFKTKEVYLNI